MSNTELLKECVAYFKSNIGFNRIFDKMRTKYMSLGTLGGTIVLDNLTPSEKDALTGLLKKDYLNKKSISIKVDKISAALANTRFEEIELEDLLNLYFSGKILTNKENVLSYEAQKNTFFDSVISCFDHTFAAKWLQYILEKKENAYNLIQKSFNESSNKDRLYENLMIVCNALNNLPPLDGKPIRLALLASRISLNPHSFDQGTFGGSLLLHGLAYMANSPAPSSNEERSELLYKCGIISDEVSNYTICSGLQAYFWDNSPHPGWAGFLAQSEPLHISLANLATVDRIYSPSKKVFVFENPTVFSQIFSETLNIAPSLICTNGQLKLASLVLLDKLAQNADSIYYSGDFDPEGIMIADKLKQRYGDRLILWNYTSDIYLKIKSNTKISTERLKKLEKLRSPELKVLAHTLQKDKYAAYQELLVDAYRADIFKLLEYNHTIPSILENSPR